MRGEKNYSDKIHEFLEFLLVFLSALFVSTFRQNFLSAKIFWYPRNLSFTYVFFIEAKSVDWSLII